MEAPRPGPTLVVEGKGQPPPLANDEQRVDNAGRRQVAVLRRQRAAIHFSPRAADRGKRGAFIYPEWDVTINAYRPEWVALRPRRLRQSSTEWVDRVLRRRHAQVQALESGNSRRCAPSASGCGGKEDGEDFDYRRDRRGARRSSPRPPPGERPYARTREDKRDIAVAF
ncbi:MAG: hypothetical protein U0841_28130 [Chloroflexia bacterium]